MSTWLVTGGCGFIGSHLVEALLRRGDRVRVLDNLSSGRRDNLPEEVDLRIADVANERAVAAALEGAAGCFHLAAVSSVPRCTEDWLGSHRINLTGTITVFEKARRSGRSAPVPVVYTSSAAVYGDNRQLPLGETSDTRPISAYGADKLACELHGKIAWSVHRVPNVGLRLFNVYGPRQDPASPYSGVITKFVDRLVRGEDLEIFGNGSQTRDFVYVADAVSHLLKAMADLRSGAHVFNVCTGTGTTILELATMLAQLWGKPPTIRYGSRPNGDIEASVGDPAAAIKALGVTAQTLLVDGLRGTLSWRRRSGTGASVDRGARIEQAIL
jgi:UDP-glucose 4-epimerase